MKRLLILAFLLLPATAQAKPHPTNPLRLAYTHAVSYLHEAPCGGHVRIKVQAFRPSAEELAAYREIYGRKDIEPLSWASGCTVSFNVEYWWSWRAIDDSWETACVAMIHELQDVKGEPETVEDFETTNTHDALIEQIVLPYPCRHYTLVRPDGRIERKGWNPQ